MILSIIIEKVYLMYTSIKNKAIIGYRPSIILLSSLFLFACDSSSSNNTANSVTPVIDNTSATVNEPVDIAANNKIEYKGISEKSCTEVLPTEAVDFNNLEIELVKNGFKGAEGPVWITSENKLFFSEINRDPAADMITNADLAIANIIALDPETKEHEVWLEASGSNGLALSSDGQSIIAAVTPKAEVVSFNLSDKSETFIAGKLNDGTAFNATNDIAVRSDGTIYMTDPTWGGMRTDGGDPAPMSTPAISISPNGEAVVIDNDLIQPNGIALSPDEKTLYVNGIVGMPKSFGWRAPSVLYAYDVADDGSVSNRRKLINFESGADGMTLDCAGNLYTTTRGAIIVLNPEGKKLGTIPVFHSAYQASNVAFGGIDGKTLFITVEQRVTRDADQTKEYGIYKIDLPMQGVPY